jgi:hypothetical protein
MLDLEVNQEKSMLIGKMEKFKPELEFMMEKQN